MVMYFLTRKMGDKDTSEIQRMIPRRDFVEKWKHLENGAHDLAKKLTSKEAATNSGSWKILSAAAPENILFLSLTTKQQAVDQKLKNFLTKWRQVREKLPFPEMAELRITAQLPEYPKILDEAFLLLLDGKLRSHNEIVNFLKPYEPPPPPPPPAPKRGRGKAAAAVEAAASAPAVAVTAPAKRGRKPKGAAAAAPPAVAAPPVPAVAVKAAANAKAPTPPKPVAVAKKAAPAKAAKKAAEPAKKAAPAAKKPAVAKKAMPSKVKTVAKKAPAKKTVAKKPTAKKAAKKKR
jgi:hypothetical protein